LKFLFLLHRLALDEFLFLVFLFHWLAVEHLLVGAATRTTLN